MPSSDVRFWLAAGDNSPYRRRPVFFSRGSNLSKFLKLASCAAAAFVYLAPVTASAGITGGGASYTLDCSDGLQSSQTVSATQTTTVTIQNCAYFLMTGTGISPLGNNPTGGAPIVVTVSPGAVGRVDGYNAGQPPAGADARLTFVAPPPPAAVPTMSEWAMILFAIAMAGAAAIMIQKRRTA